MIKLDINVYQPPCDEVLNFCLTFLSWIVDPSTSSWSTTNSWWRSLPSTRSEWNVTMFGVWFYYNDFKNNSGWTFGYRTGKNLKKTYSWNTCIVEWQFYSIAFKPSLYKDRLSFRVSILMFFCFICQLKRNFLKNLFQVKWSSYLKLTPVLEITAHPTIWDW